MFLSTSIYGQENAAPSMHLNLYFPSSDAVLKMMKIKITRSAFASYFEVNSFNHGYAGLQQTPDTSFGTPNILLSSLWDANTAEGIFSNVEYTGPGTIKSRFGGEGDGWKTIHPYGWSLNTWYNIVIRAWKSDGRLLAATFVNDLSTGQWLHTATISIPFEGTYLKGRNDAFLENWDGTDHSCDGSYIRKAFFKDAWNLNLKGSWEKNSGAQCSVNNSIPDIERNGICHNSFDAGYNSDENAYFMQHGGNTTPSAAFDGKRTLSLPVQTGQGVLPVLNTPEVTSFSASSSNDSIVFRWLNNDSRTPQFSSKLEIRDSSGKICFTSQDTLPQRRSYSKALTLKTGKYTASLTIIDIFNQTAPVKSCELIIPGIKP